MLLQNTELDELIPASFLFFPSQQSIRKKLCQEGLESGPIYQSAENGTKSGVAGEVREFENGPD